MGSQERRLRQKEALREKILDAARELFASNGFDATTMRMIANRIEYSATAIYSYFEDKEALLRELCEADFTALHRSMETALAVSDPVQRLEQIGELFVDFALQHPNHYRFMFMSPPSPAASPDSTRLPRTNAPEKAYAFLRRAVEEVAATGVIRPEFRDVDLLTQIVWGAMHGVVTLHLTVKDVGYIHFHPLKEVSRMMRLALATGVAEAPSPATSA